MCAQRVRCVHTMATGVGCLGVNTQGSSFNRIPRICNGKVLVGLRWHSGETVGFLGFPMSMKKRGRRSSQ